MKAASLLVLSILTATGCATLNSGPGSSVGSASGGNAGATSTAASDPFPPHPFPPQEDTTSPRLIIPATGGAPVIGIPVGGNLYVPVTGGPPVVGISIGP